MLRDLQAVEKGCICPFFAKNGGKRFYFLILKTTLVFIMYDGSLTNNLLVVIYFIIEPCISLG